MENSKGNLILTCNQEFKKKKIIAAKLAAYYNYLYKKNVRGK